MASLGKRVYYSQAMINILAATTAVKTQSGLFWASITHLTWALCLITQVGGCKSHYNHQSESCATTFVHVHYIQESPPSSARGNGRDGWTPLFDLGSSSSTSSLSPVASKVILSGQGWPTPPILAYESHLLSSKTTGCTCLLLLPDVSTTWKQRFQRGKNL